MTSAIPCSPEAFDARALQSIVQTDHPGVTVDEMTVLDHAITSSDDHRVSTARRITVAARWSGPESHQLPERMTVKVARPEFGDLPLYANEVNVYAHLLRELDIATPHSYGGRHDVASGTFGLAMEDVRLSSARFRDVTQHLSIDETRALLRTLASVHAHYWDTARFGEDLVWLHPHTSGPLFELFSGSGVYSALVEHEVSSVQFKRELTLAIDESPSSLRSKVAVVQQHQATLSTTVLHGDAHIGNTYSTPTQPGAFLDWQLTARGYCMHDVSYLVTTGLTVAQRREHEESLITFYRDVLCDLGVPSPPTFDELWLEHRRAQVWGMYVGWLGCPVDNYGWDITVNNHIRLSTAYRDLDTAAAIDALR